MADLSADRSTRDRGDGRDAEAERQVAPEATASEPRTVADQAPLDRRAAAGADARAVRVRTAPASTLGDEEPLRLSPVPDALRMTNPTIGVGPLGGAVLDGDPVEVEPTSTSVLAQRQLLLDGEPIALGLEPMGHGRHVLLEPAVRTRVVLEPGHAMTGGIRRREVLVDGFRFEIDVESERIAALRERASRGRAASAHSGPLEIRAIIPGRVVSVSIAPGDEVTAGQQLLAVEAMKMQNELRAPRDGAVERVAVSPGMTIEVGDLLVVIS